MATTILVVTALPDDRPSTALLEDIVAELDRRAGVTVVVWYLRRFAGAPPLPSGRRVVDRLRTWAPAAALEFAGLGRIAHGLRGWRLRRWLAAVAPDVVVFDDGFGERILGPAQDDAVRVVRLNDQGSEFAHLEPEPAATADLWILPPGYPAPDTAVTLPNWPLTDDPRARYFGRLAEPEERRRTRLSVGLGAEAFVVVGWGAAGWLDGPDLFIRTLWALQARHGIRADGLWLLEHANTDEQARLQAEAERCGVGDRFRLAPRTAELRTCGDVALRPYRAPAEDAITEVFQTGLQVVTFACSAIEDPNVVVVDDLDVEAAAAAIAAVDISERPARVHAAHQRYLTGWTDRFLETVGGLSS